MSIKQVEVRSGTARAPREGKLLLRCTLIICALAATPVLYEGTLVCYGHWMWALDRPVDVHTPILDRIGNTFGAMRHDTTNFVSSYADHAALDTKTVLAAGLVVMAVAAFMLRS